jgi:hypothetical protein
LDVPVGADRGLAKDRDAVVGRDIIAVVTLFDSRLDKAVAAERQLTLGTRVGFVVVAVVALFAGIDDRVAAIRARTLVARTSGAVRGARSGIRIAVTVTVTITVTVAIAVAIPNTAATAIFAFTFTAGERGIPAPIFRLASDPNGGQEQANRTEWAHHPPTLPHWQTT